MKGIHQFAANLLSYIPTKYYWNRSTSDLVIAKSKRVNVFLKHSVDRRLAKKSWFSTNISLYLGNDTRLSHSYHARRIGNRTKAFEWYHFQWLWVTSMPWYGKTRMAWLPDDGKTLKTCLATSTCLVDVVSGSLYRRTHSHSLSRLAWYWVRGRLAPFYIHQMNRVNSRNGSAMMTAP